MQLNWKPIYQAGTGKIRTLYMQSILYQEESRNWAFLLTYFLLNQGKWLLWVLLCPNKIAFVFKKEMATHSSTLAWKIPWTEEPGRLQCMGSQRVRHDWVTSLIVRIWKVRVKTDTCTVMIHSPLGVKVRFCCSCFSPLPVSAEGPS